MGRIFAFLLFSIVSFSAFAQIATVQALHTDQSMVTHLILPFRISNANVQGYEVLLRSRDGSCGYMKDPFIKENLLVKCLRPDQFWMQITLTTDVGVQVLDYGPVSVIAPGSGVVVGGPNPSDPQYTLGQNLFTSNCASCHSKNGGLRPIPGRTAAQITTAINTVSAMRTIVLTQAEKEAIAYYLGK